MATYLLVQRGTAQERLQTPKRTTRYSGGLTTQSRRTDGEYIEETVRNSPGKTSTRTNAEKTSVRTEGERRITRNTGTKTTTLNAGQREQTNSIGARTRTESGTEDIGINLSFAVKLQTKNPIPEIE